MFEFFPALVQLSKTVNLYRYCKRNKVSPNDVEHLRRKLNAIYCSVTDHVFGELAREIEGGKK